MKPCKWCMDEVCVNDDCPACADYCPMDTSECDRWGMCKYYEGEET